MADTIQYTNSKELLQPNFLKEWKGFTVTRQLKEGETLYEAGEKLIAEMDHLHKLYLQSSSLSPVDKEIVPEVEVGRNEKIQGYYEIIKLADTYSKLSMHKGNVEKINDPALTDMFQMSLERLKQSEIKIIMDRTEALTKK